MKKYWVENRKNLIKKEKNKGIIGYYGEFRQIICLKNNIFLYRECISVQKIS